MPDLPTGRFDCHPSIFFLLFLHLPSAVPFFRLISWRTPPSLSYYAILHWFLLSLWLFTTTRIFPLFWSFFRELYNKVKTQGPTTMIEYGPSWGKKSLGILPLSSSGLPCPLFLLSWTSIWVRWTCWSLRVWPPISLWIWPSRSPPRLCIRIMISTIYSTCWICLKLLYGLGFYSDL